MFFYLGLWDQLFPSNKGPYSYW